MGSRFMRSTALLVAAAGAATGGAFAWLGMSSASGTQPASSAGALTFSVPTIGTTCGNDDPVSIELFVESPTAALTEESVFNGTCQGGQEEVDGAPPLTVSDAAVGTYEIGVEVTAPSGAGSNHATFYPTVTNGKGVTIAAGPGVAESQSSGARVQNLVPFVYNPKLFKLSAG
jgi:hypothetical protein